MTASAGQWWTETRAGGAELSCWRHETLEGSLGAAHEDPSSPAGRRRGALCTGASWQVPAPSLGLTSCPGGEQPLGLLGVGTWGAGSPQAGMVLEEGGNVWLPVGTPCPGLWQCRAGRCWGRAQRWVWVGVCEIAPILCCSWRWGSWSQQGRSGAPGLPRGRGDRGSSVPSPRRGRQRGPAAGASSSSWPPAGSPLPPSHDWSGGAALPHADTGQPGQFAVPAARSAFCLLPRPSPALPGSARCHPRRGWWHGDGRATRLISCLLQAKHCPELPSCCPSRPLPPPNAASRSRRREER